MTPQSDDVGWLHASIIVLAGENAGRSYNVDDEIVIGRANDAGINVVGHDVSRHHVRIHREEERYFLTDRGSRNGTRLNGIFVKKAELHFGDRITIGTSAILLFTHRDRLEAQFLQSQKMESLGRLAGGIAHDFNNLLGSVLTNLEFMKSLGGDTLLGEEDVSSALSDSTEALKRAIELTRQLLGFARQGKYQDRPIDVVEVAKEVARLLRRSTAENVQLVVDATGGHFVIGDPTQIHQVLMNLAINACDAMPDGGTVTLRVKRGEDEPGMSPTHLLAHRPHVILEVQDTGVGMDERTLKRAFEPFYTTKPVGQGTGLGLAMVYGIARNHGGDVQVDSRPGQGTTVRLFFPCTDGAPERRIETPTHEDEGEIVLVVDDDDLFRSGTCRLLRHMGFRVVESSSGADAVVAYEEYGPGIAAVLLDLKMPNMNGEETFDALREIDPEARVLIVSGYANETHARDIVSRGARAFLQKPFDAHSLRESLSLTLG